MVRQVYKRGEYEKGREKKEEITVEKYEDYRDKTQSGPGGTKLLRDVLYPHGLGLDVAQLALFVNLQI
ncbi:MAG: hypothetical protein ABSE81_04940 [Candidatus Omnitrophota bacterium]